MPSFSLPADELEYMIGRDQIGDALPVEGYIERLGPHERAIPDQVLSCASIGTREIVRADLHNFVKQTGANELMITSQIFDHTARLRSLEIAAEAFADVPLDRKYQPMTAGQAR
jgi:hypothetical protein